MEAAVLASYVQNRAEEVDMSLKKQDIAIRILHTGYANES